MQPITADDIERRVCRDEDNIANEGVAMEIVESEAYDFVYLHAIVYYASHPFSSIHYN